MAPDVIPTSEACQLSGLTSARIRQLIKENRIVAFKLGRDWLIERESFERFLAMPRNAGRPKTLALEK